MSRILLCLFTVALLAGCQFRASRANADEKTYAGKGQILHISDDRHLVTIRHDAIPGYMMAMTMDFPVRDEHLLDGMTPGDLVDFTLKVTQSDAWVAVVQRTGHANLSNDDSPLGGSGKALIQRGQLLPDVSFVAEDGRTVKLSDFRGKIVVFTFFFTRCPLPNFCPLMNQNFAKARELLLSTPGAPRNWQFLSISFDPDFDRPQTLASYAPAYRGQNPDRWLFVAATPEALGQLASPLGLVVMRSGNSISHNLRTVVVDPQGQLYRQYSDNLWTPEELVEAIREAGKT
jgi:protein SCO1/2